MILTGVNRSRHMRLSIGSTYLRPSGNLCGSMLCSLSISWGRAGIPRLYAFNAVGQYIHTWPKFCCQRRITEKKNNQPGLLIKWRFWNTKQNRPESQLKGVTWIWSDEIEALLHGTPSTDQHVPKGLPHLFRSPCNIHIMILTEMFARCPWRFSRIQ